MTWIHLAPTSPSRRRRAAARPSLEPLEMRTLLTAGVLAGVGTLGTSLTVEAQFSPQRETSRVWLEQLATSRGVNFGEFRGTTNWDSARARGYEFNWATPGARLSNEVLAHQLPGLTNHVATGRVTLAIIEHTDTALNYAALYNGTLSGETLAASVVANLTTIVDTLTAVGDVKLVLTDEPDYGVAPTVRNNPSFSNPVSRQRATDATVVVVDAIRAFAAARDLPVVSTFWLGNLVHRADLTVGGVSIDRTSAVNFQSNPTHFFEDTGHPGTVAHGLFANMFLEAINQAYLGGVAPLSEQEILTNAFLTPPFAGPTYFDVREGVIVNRAPTAHAGGPYAVPEGGPLTLNASASSDPEGDALTYTWDVNGDGVFGDATGVNPTLSAAQLQALGLADGPLSRTVKVRVTDGHYGRVLVSQPTTLTVSNAPPAVTVSGPSAAVPGHPMTYTFTATDPSPVDQAGAFTYAIDWDGNGTVDQTVSGPGVAQVTHTYPATGSYAVRVTATDRDGGVSPVASHAVTVAHALVQNGDLLVGGTAGGDRINFIPSGGGGVSVDLNGVSLGAFYPTARIVAYGLAGDDDIQVAGGITLSAWLYGDTGNDRLKGGAGDDVLLGQAGDDLLVGGGGRDLLIGGVSADRIVGNADDDILIAGVLSLESDASALCAIMHEWTRTDQTGEQRVAHLRDGGGLNGTVVLNATTVANDLDADVLTGTSGFDWFLFDSTRDRATDLTDETFTLDLPFING